MAGAGYQRHTLATYEHDGDLIVACCVGCSWRSDGFDTKREAKTAHADHVLSERLKSAQRPTQGNPIPRYNTECEEDHNT